VRCCLPVPFLLPDSWTPASSWRCLHHHGGACIIMAVPASSWQCLHHHGGACIIMAVSACLAAIQ